MIVVFWALAYIAMMGTLFALAGDSIASLMAAMESLQGAQEPSPEQMAAIWRSYVPLFALVIPVSLLFGAVMNAAVVRSVVRPEQSAFGYLRLGMDELRTLAVTIVLAVLYGVFIMVAAIAMGVLAGLTANADIPALWILVVLAGLGLVVWLAVRFSLAVPITVAEGRIAIFDSFAMTRKHVWPLIGMAIIAWIMSMVVGLLGGLVALPVTMLLGGGGDLATMDGQTTLQILQAAWPMVAGWIAVQSVLSALQLAVVYAPYSAAYRDLKAG